MQLNLSLILQFVKSVEYTLIDALRLLAYAVSVEETMVSTLRRDAPELSSRYVTTMLCDTFNEDKLKTIAHCIGYFQKGTLRRSSEGEGNETETDVAYYAVQILRGALRCVDSVCCGHFVGWLRSLFITHAFTQDGISRKKTCAHSEYERLNSIVR